MMKMINRKKTRKVLLIITVIVLITVLIRFVYASTRREYKILVDVEESKLYLFENNELIKTYKCSGGKLGTPSPIGTWKITFKAKWGEGFGGSFLGLNVPWGKFGIHGTQNPNSVGWPSSHRLY